MKTFIILAFIATAASALAIESEAEHVNGVNGWSIPKSDGTFEWVSIEEAQRRLDTYKTQGRSEIEVQYYLYTVENEKPEEIFDVKESIEASSFNPKLPTKFIIHGWQSSAESEWVIDVAQAWLSKGSYNMIVVNWSAAKNFNYFYSVDAVAKVGKKVGAFINFLHKKFNMPIDTLQCIGHSLGAHTCGYTAKNVNGKMHTIVGLDPALPLFNYDKPELRLNSEDATYVESIQTNGGRLGFLDPIGKNAFYPNGGKEQPGCVFDLTGACSHNRSTKYYAAAVARNNFPAVKCSDYKAAIEKKCGATYGANRMAAPRNYMLEGGQYYVPVSSEFPYGLGN